MKSTSLAVSNLKNARKSSHNGRSSVTGLPAEFEGREPFGIGRRQPMVTVRIGGH